MRIGTIFFSEVDVIMRLLITAIQLIALLLTVSLMRVSFADDLKPQLADPLSTSEYPADAYRILVIGDSISRHGFNAGTIANLKWDHVAGMAASGESKDYVHLLSARIFGALHVRPIALKFIQLGAGTTAVRLAPLSDSSGYNPDLVVFQHGEHEDQASGAAALSATYNGVLDFLQALPSHPKIVCVGVWDPYPYPNGIYSGWCAVIEHTMSDICAKRGLPFVSVEKFAQDPTCHGAGQTPGVQWHPNDEGHAHYADAIFKAVVPLLSLAR